MIWDKLNERLIFTQLEVKDKYELFKILGQKLIDFDLCEPSFIQALSERENVFATGLQIEDMGVAIPHTDAQHVKKQAIAIATLKYPIAFYHMGSDDVKVDINMVIMLAIPGKQHMEVLQSVILLIQDIQVIKEIMDADNPKEIIEIIKRKEVQSHESI